MRYRQRAASDLAYLALVLQDVHQVDGYPTRWPADPERWLASKSSLGAWIAESAGSPYGHVGLHEVRDEDCRPGWAAVTGRRADGLAEVSRLFVAPAMQGNGVGRRLLDMAVGEAHARGLWPVLDVVADGRPAAEGLYREASWDYAGSGAWFPWEGRRLAIHCWVGPAPRSKPGRTARISRVTFVP